MRKFAQIIDGKVHWRFDAEENPYAHMDPGVLDIRDVTDVTPTPEEGWLAHTDGTYSAPPAPPPPPPPVTKVRAISTPEFVKLGMAVNFAGMNAALAAMPALGILLQQYMGFQGIEYADATTPGTVLKSAMDAIVSGGFYTEQQKQAFLDAWAAQYTIPVPG
jgi:hypothetical protein